MSSTGTLTLGQLVLDGRFLLAPLEGVSDVGFRRVCREAGAALTWTEMIRAKGIARRNRSTLDLIDTVDAETPTGVQLLATGVNELTTALQVLEELAQSERPHFKNIRSIDLNFGCPSRDVVGIGAGPALLKRRAKLQGLFEALRAWQKTNTLGVVDVGAKIRLGLNQGERDHKIYLGVVELANATLDHLIVHGRHAGQRSRDRADWRAIAEAKAAATIPVIGNGDVFCAADAKRMVQETGVDGVLIARGAIENPWIFRGLQGGAEAANTAEVEAATATWKVWAERSSAKDKYRAFHDENFARLAGRARGERSSLKVPKNAHMG